jgi:hypothetical protein
MRTVMLAARRSDGGFRDESWEWIRTRWEANSDIPIFVGYDEGDHPFNRSKAMNEAHRAAGDWDMAIISDADSFVGFDQIDDAIRVADETGLMTLAFTRFSYVNKHGSRLIKDGFDGYWGRYVDWCFDYGCSSMLAVPREVWEAVGGFDEGFEGWGEEDVAFSLACQTMAPARWRPGAPERDDWYNRLPGECWHLWHPVQPTNNRKLPGFWRNVERRELYVKAAHKPDRMRALLVELGVLDDPDAAHPNGPPGDEPGDRGVLASGA